MRLLQRCVWFTGNSMVIVNSPSGKAAGFLAHDFKPVPNATSTISLWKSTSTALAPVPTVYFLKTLPGVKVFGLGENAVQSSGEQPETPSSTVHLHGADGVLQ